MLPSTHEPVPPFAPGDLLFWRYRYGRAIPADVAAFMANRAGGMEQHTRPRLMDCTGGWDLSGAFASWDCRDCGATQPGACRAGRWKERGFDARERDERDTHGGATDCGA